MRKVLPKVRLSDAEKAALAQGLMSVGSGEYGREGQEDEEYESEDHEENEAHEVEDDD